MCAGEGRGVCCMEYCVCFQDKVTGEYSVLEEKMDRVLSDLDKKEEESTQLTEELSSVKVCTIHVCMYVHV